ncbi:unnamed protein product [Rotaria sp. Silwood1]|nr:unnamed protein product [Rotaria sp. Silwood1]CAF1634842.1 unnamed protein product [Rotaria sp. Silwood1]CAF3770409.1 unnamed protein product [Rotaria sp. Silwood1]CAF3804311.1 unnamed protein product [Rotaria sp. Silwood1]CAF3878998.1 unnamed protein product [Rotaria sp. Silwood1]
MNEKEILPQFDLDTAALFTSDEDDNNDDGNDNLMETQYSTPTAQENRFNQTPTKGTTAVTTTSVLQITLPPSTPIRSSLKRRQQPTTETIRKDIELIDLVTPKKSPQGLHQPNYIRRTLHFFNQQRLSILPTFPIVHNDNDDSDLLLLANVCPMQLSPTELVRRQHGQYKHAFDIRDPNASETSFMVQQYQIYYVSILERFNVDLPIVDHNYARLKYVLELFRKARMRTLSANNKRLEHTLYLKDSEMPLLLEFYLQMDIDLFYMKTCSFRDAQPRSKTEGIFCATLPECRYKITPCGHCKLCRTPVDMKYRSQAPILFNRYGKHEFVNRYQSILNCPATCNTTNIIYVLTCLCGQFDYVSETAYTLAKRFDGHRQLANKAVCNLLIGKENVIGLAINQQYASSSSDKEYMSLYQHPTQCSATIQMFLDYNKLYWRFVPMKIEEANQDDANYQRASATTTTTTMSNVHFDKNIRIHLKHVPKPPADYKFSKRQIEKQAEFFQKYSTSPPTNEQVDLYNANIIAVLPPNTSDLFRQHVHSLFVTHTEAKLNTLGHIFESNINIHSAQHVWCANLVRRPNLSMSQRR